VLLALALIGAATSVHAAENAAPEADSQASAPSSAAEAAPSPKAEPKPAANLDKTDNLLNLDIEQLGKVPVRTGSQQTNLTSPSSQLSARGGERGETTTTAELLTQAPSVSARRVSAITLDPRVRGYHSNQLNGSANGITQLKARVDIDSLFSQIDPGVVQNVTIIDGPYTSLYGPGFAFIMADLLQPPRYPSAPETHLSSNFVYGTNAQTLYSRDNVISGGKDWGVCASYGLRTGNDYQAGGESGFLVPSRYQKWDGLLAVNYDLNSIGRVEFDCLRTEMNDVELPGVVYDIQSSVNEQYNLSYFIQDDPNGPKQLQLQSWYNRTAYHGDASRASKQASLYQAFFTEPAFADLPVNTLGTGSLDSLGVRLLRTFGQADAPQLTVGADWRRYRQQYEEDNVDAAGAIVFGGNVYGIPRSQMDDCGVLADYALPLTDRFTVNVGGRVDQCTPSLDTDDPVITQITDPTLWYYEPGYFQTSRTLGMAYVTARQKVAEASTLKAGTAFAMRGPDLTELYNDEPYVPFNRFGNTYIDGLSNLKPEKNLQVDLGLTYDNKKTSYGVRGFFSIVRDYIMPVPAIIDPTAPYPPFLVSKVLGRDFSSFPAIYRTDLGTVNENGDTCQAGYQYVNVDCVTFLGGDLFGETKLTDRFAVFGSMSYVYGVNNTPVCFVNDPSFDATIGTIVPLSGTDGVPGIYPLNGTVGFRILEPEEDRWCIEFGARMVRTQDHVAVTLSEVPNPGFTTFNLKGYYRVRKNVRVSLDLENLLNRYYSEPDSLAIMSPSGLPVYVPEAGFSALMGVEARF
jgi:outer membrane receptor protein involved in Fe transport